LRFHWHSRYGANFFTVHFAYAIMADNMSDMQESLPRDLADTVRGDLQAFSRLQRRSNKDIQQARDSLGELVVTAQDVRRVLVSLLEHKVSPEQAESWAFFMRHGYIGHWQSQPITQEVRSEFERSGSRLLAIYQAVPNEHNGPIPPAIDVEYDDSTEDSIADAEDSIADVIARLEHASTEIQGEITEREITELLRNLADTSEEDQRD
jgi:hypothetical protein